TREAANRVLQHREADGCGVRAFLQVPFRLDGLAEEVVSVRRDRRTGQRAPAAVRACDEPLRAGEGLELVEAEQIAGDRPHAAGRGGLLLFAWWLRVDGYAHKTRGSGALARPTSEDAPASVDARAGLASTAAVLGLRDSG